mmetsp:Transcript_4843/g.8655  ORF Transcript_4843/g.8655 Transcript_4843/m.8655 type:complete len:385 (-) Transcript_4843:60-1214(-)
MRRVDVLCVVTLVLLASIAKCQQDDRAEILTADGCNEEPTETVLLQTNYQVAEVTSAEKLQVAAGASQRESRVGSDQEVWVVVAVVMAALILLPVIFISMTDIGSSKPAQSLLAGNEQNKFANEGGAASQSRRSLPSEGALPPRDSTTQARVQLPPTSRAVPSPDENPPPICQSLILPNTEARFLAGVDCLQKKGPQAFSLFGGSGRRLLHVSIEERAGVGHKLSIASVGCEGTPRAFVMSGRSRNYEIYSGRDNQFYGSLEFAGDRLLLLVDGYPVMALDSSDEFKMIASRMDGRILASAQQVSAQLPETNQAWMLQVRPGMDAILVACCMLTSMLLPTPTGYATPSLPGRTPYGSAAASARSIQAPSARSIRSEAVRPSTTK